MARKPASADEAAVKPEAAAKPAGTPGKDGRTAAIEALLSLIGERSWSEVGLPEIAAGAGLTLAELRALFPSKGAILAAFSRQIDQAVLKRAETIVVADPPRERLAAVLGYRLEALWAHKIAVGAAAKALAHDPLGLAEANRMVVNSMQWMLAAAAIPSDGPMGAVRAQGLAIAWSRILNVWLEDDEVGEARTQAEIDRQLDNGERWLGHLDGLLRLAEPFRRFAERSMDRHPPSSDEGVRERARSFAEDVAGAARRAFRRDDAGAA